MSEKISREWESAIYSLSHIPILIEEINVLSAVSYFDDDEGRWIIRLPSSMSENIKIVLLAHEWGHVRWGSFELFRFIMKRFDLKKKESLQYLLNVAEDIRVDRKNMKIYGLYSMGMRELVDKVKNIREVDRKLFKLLSTFFYNVEVEGKLKEIYELADNLAEFSQSDEWMEKYTVFLEKIKNFLGWDRKGISKERKMKIRKMKWEDRIGEMRKDFIKKERLAKRYNEGKIIEKEDLFGVVSSVKDKTFDNMVEVEEIEEVKRIFKNFKMIFEMRGAYEEVGNRIDIRRYIYSKLNGRSDSKLFFSNNGRERISMKKFILYQDVSTSMITQMGMSDVGSIIYTAIKELKRVIEQRGGVVEVFNFSNTVEKGLKKFFNGGTMLRDEDLRRIAQQSVNSQVIVFSDGEIHLGKYARKLRELKNTPILFILNFTSLKHIEGFEIIKVGKFSELRRGLVELIKILRRRFL